MSQDIRHASERKLNFFQTLKAILWGGLGIRKGAGYTDDAAKLNPVHVILAGILAAVLFVSALVLLAKWAINASI